MSKSCQKCNAEKRFSDFYPGRHYCKTCVLEVGERRRQRYRDASDSMKSESTWGDCLYVLTNPRIPGEVKVGRANEPETRAQTLSQGQNFTLRVEYTYAHKGYLETAAHRRFSPWKVGHGPGREWFRLQPKEANLLLQALILEDDLNPGGPVRLPSDDSA
jgi:hypothetical protein